MIKGTLRIHDRFQLELKLDCPFNLNGKGVIYHVEHFFSFPRSLDIHQKTFPPYLFYRNFQTYIRFKTPVWTLEDLISKENSPLHDLQAQFEAFDRKRTAESLENFEGHHKLFCCIFKSAVRKHHEWVRNESNSDTIRLLITDYLSNAKNILQIYRNFQRPFQQSSSISDWGSIYSYCDEYLSLMIERQTYELLEFLKKVRFDVYKAFKSSSLQLIQQEIDYRTQRQYPSLPVEQGGNETLVYRRNLLKRYTSSILFLGTLQKTNAGFLKQVVISLAAGLAMVFATGIAFFSQQHYGNLTQAFFIALVVGYMFKDRIKELTQIYLKGSILNRFYDYKSYMYNDHQSKRGLVGLFHEKVHFKKHENLPPFLIKLQKEALFKTDFYTWDHVLSYRKRIKIFSQKISKAPSPFVITGTHDISIFNVEPFIKKMDNPEKELYMTDGQDYWKIPGQKVYHIHLILEYSSQKNHFFQHFKIILNREGIKRIEEETIPADPL